ncbi:glycerophosphodiester phosphodiesterase [Halobacterium litoreum]|uniref:Glycerophosphodiester phosphodiesterase n=1 Tax=Halobacterium litoreum TaxID=2039234 RepID=A0ABD5NDE3_9EURY|nr:glycerophosphodiester phosphodiesterase [Halobacterium litoreum]UHH13815.1 glycerophosphodiester phosphodiesterase [Halobacterium litoreum]
MYELAHRGFAGVAPENTLAAVESAVNRAHGVEVDVQPASDGTPVVFHDHRLDAEADSRGVTDRSGFVWDATPDELADADVLGSGEGVPTLADVAGVVPAGTEFHVELKSPGSEDARLGLPGPDASQWRPFVEAVTDALADCDAPVVFSSFFDGALEAAREVAPDTARAALCLDADRGLTRASEFDCRAFHPPLDAVDADLVDRAHGNGHTVNVWTIENWQDAHACREAGADGVITDYPGVLAWADGGAGW